MTVALHNTATFPTPRAFSHAGEACGSRIVYICGQAGTDDNGTLVAGRPAAQVNVPSHAIVSHTPSDRAGAGRGTAGDGRRRRRRDRNAEAADRAPADLTDPDV